MDIIKTMVTRTAEEKTAHGVYNVEFTVCDNTLERISATIRKADDKGLPGEYLGSVVYEASSINLSLINTGAALAPLVEDFERLIQTIRSCVSSQQEPTK